MFSTIQFNQGIISIVQLTTDVAPELVWSGPVEYFGYFLSTVYNIRMRRRSRQRMRRRSRLEQRKPESDPRRSELLDQRVCSENRRPWGSCAGSPPPWSSTTPACTQTHTRSCLGRPSCRNQAWNKRWQCWMRRGRPAPACCTRGWWG